MESLFSFISFIISFIMGIIVLFVLPIRQKKIMKKLDHMANNQVIIDQKVSEKKKE